MAKLVVEFKSSSKEGIWIPLTTACKSIKESPVNKPILRLLKEKGYLMNDFIPHQKYVKAGYFKVLKHSKSKSEGETSKELTQILMSPKGFRLIIRESTTEKKL